MEIAGALGAYRDALTLVDGVREHAGPDHLPGLLARRGDLLMSLGEPGAVEAYTEAARITTGTRHRLVRARLARAAAVGGDLEVARSALAGLDLEGDEADASLLLGQGMVAYFTGDMETARRVAAEARERLRGIDDPWQVVDLVGLHGLLAHHRGEWFPSFRTELRRTHGQERLAGALFDAHLCVAENLLYGREPYPEIIAEAEQLRLRARMAGALRGVAFASALIGEAALMMGDLTRAEAELEEAITLNADLDALGGQAHGMQRLAEVRLAQGRTDEARQLLDEALLLARWSPMGMHLLQRIFGTLIASEPDPQSARLMVDRAEEHPGGAGPVLVLHRDARRPCRDRLRPRGRPRGRPPLPGLGLAFGGAVGRDFMEGRRPRGARRGRARGGRRGALPHAQQGGRRGLLRRRSRRGRRPVPGRRLILLTSARR